MIKQAAKQTSILEKELKFKIKSYASQPNKLV